MDRPSEMIGVTAVCEPRLMEQNFGKWEGTARDGLDFKKDKENFVISYEGGESMLRLCQRIYNHIDDLKDNPNEVCLLVAHNGISRAVQPYFTDMTNEEFATFGIKNCEIREFEFKQDEII